MFKKGKSIAAAAAAFVAGGAAVGAFTLATGVAHGTTTPIPGLKMSAPEFTASYAWQQSIAVPASGSSAPVTLSVPSGQRLTIISVSTGGGIPSNGIVYCTLSETLNGASVSTNFQASYDGSSGSVFLQPLYLDSGSVTSCTDAQQNAAGSVTLVGYLTPIPPGQT
jgi:hypothetical protein